MTLIFCDYDAERGMLKRREILSTVPKDVTDKNGSTAETAVHPSGKFGYVSTYVSNCDPDYSIVIFAIEPLTKKLTDVGYQNEGIQTRRNFAIEPTGKYMLVANQEGGVESDQVERVGCQPRLCSLHGNPLRRHRQYMPPLQNYFDQI